MDWRLIAAVSGAAGSFCFLVIGAYVVFTHDPPPPRTAAPAPMLVSGYRFAITTTPSPVSMQPPSPFGPDPSAQGPLQQSPPAPSPFAPQGSAAPPSSNPPRLAVDGIDAGPHGAAPPPLIEAKKSSVVPELHASRYRGVLTSAEIVRVKSSLRLTPEQERTWPPVEAALTEMGRQQIALIRRGQQPRIDPSDWPPGRLYAAAGPLLQTLRPDQKEAVRRLCRSLGFEDVASTI
jgi:hypothetical protein